MKIKKSKKKKKMKKILFRKNPTKLSWPMSAKSDNFFFIQKEKKHRITMAHECQI